MFRILMIAPTPFFADRGCHVRILGEIRALQRRGCAVVLCTYHNGRDIPGIPTFRIPTVPWYKKLEAGPSNHKYYLDMILLLRTIERAVRGRPDVVHGHLHEGALIGRLVASAMRRPLVFDYQGSLTGELSDHGYLRNEHGLKYHVLRRMEERIDRGADRVVTSTTRAYRELSDRMGRDRVQPVLDGVDTEVFTPALPAVRARVRERYGLPQDAVLAIYVGLLTPYQGIDLLLEQASRALRRAPHLHLAIAGYPEEAYRAAAAEKGLADRITFLGRVPFEETPALTAAADIALSPKISLTEGNLKIYNYLACGLPVVVFDNPVNREILGDVGAYVPQGDAVAFADLLAALAHDAPERARLSRAGRERAVARLSWDRAAGELLEAYRAAGARAGVVNGEIRARDGTGAPRPEPPLPSGACTTTDGHSPSVRRNRGGPGSGRRPKPPAHSASGPTTAVRDADPRRGGEDGGRGTAETVRGAGR